MAIPPLPPPATPTVELEPFNSTVINWKIQVADACAVVKGDEYLDKLNDGEDCDELLKDAQKIVSLTNAIRGYVPEGEPIQGVQASAYVNPTLATSGGTFVLEVRASDAVGADTIVTYTFVSPTNNIQLFCDYMADTINDLNAYNPVAHPYTAISTTLNGGTVDIYGMYYDDNNLQYLTFIFNPVEFDFNTSLYFTGGTVTMEQGENCISEDDVNLILSKLCDTCGCEKTNINFRT